MNDGPVLLFGNGNEGVLMHTPHPGDPVVMMRPPKMTLARWDDQDFGTIMPTQVLYSPRRINFFGTHLIIHVEEGLPTERLEAMVRDHLLSDKGKAVIMEARL